MRTAKNTRETLETHITGELNLDGGEIAVDTGIGFFDHMITALAKHAGFGLTLKADGDLQVDAHHTVEDTGIVLGGLFKSALGSFNGVARYGSFFVPMDEALAFASADLSGRAFLVWSAEFPDVPDWEFDYSLAEEFWRAFAVNAGITLHMKLEYGKNAHHCCEALFKAAAHALRLAVIQTGEKPLSTKGSL